jgi:hypothetical protein
MNGGTSIFLHGVKVQAEKLSDLRIAISLTAVSGHLLFPGRETIPTLFHVRH